MPEHEHESEQELGPKITNAFQHQAGAAAGPRGSGWPRRHAGGFASAGRA